MKTLKFALCALFFAGCADMGIIETRQVTNKEAATRSVTGEDYYPVKPGTAEWRSFTTHQQMVEACQLSENVLKSLTTDELVRVCANYPLNMDAYAYSNVTIGMQAVTSRFNGYQELFKRPDNASALLGYLQEHNLNEVFDTKVQARSNVEIGEAILHYNLMENLLSFDEVLWNMDANTLKETVALINQQLELKVANPQYVGRMSLNVSAVSLGKTLQKATNGGDEQLQQIILNQGIQNNEELQLLKSKSASFTK